MDFDELILLLMKILGCLRFGLGHWMTSCLSLFSLLLQCHPADFLQHSSLILLPPRLLPLTPNWCACKCYLTSVVEDCIGIKFQTKSHRNRCKISDKKCYICYTVKFEVLFQENTKSMLHGHK